MKFTVMPLGLLLFVCSAFADFNGGSVYYGIYPNFQGIQDTTCASDPNAWNTVNKDWSHRVDSMTIENIVNAEKNLEQGVHAVSVSVTVKDKTFRRDDCVVYAQRLSGTKYGWGSIDVKCPDKKTEVLTYFDCSMEVNDFAFGFGDKPKAKIDYQPTLFQGCAGRVNYDKNVDVGFSSTKVSCVPKQ